LSVSASQVVGAVSIGIATKNTLVVTADKTIRAGFAAFTTEHTILVAGTIHVFHRAVTGGGTFGITLVVFARHTSGAVRISGTTKQTVVVNTDGLGRTV